MIKICQRQKSFTLLYIISFLLLLAQPAQSNEPLTSLRCNEFTFDATGSYDPDNEDITFQWDFGDGKSSSNPVFTHTYEKSGDYKVTLLITDNSGLKCSKAATSQMVRVNIPPYASFTSPETICVNQPALLDASASYDDSKAKLSYVWSFGDKSQTSDKKRVSKTYTKGGKYKITLNVDDNSGTACHQQIAERTIIVNEPPVAKAHKKNILKCSDNDEPLVIEFDASRSSDVNNDSLSYLWDFGDGEKAEGIKVSHQYDTIGNYDAKLIVKDNTTLGCGTSVDFVTVRINKAPIAEAGKDIIACTGETIDFDGRESSAGKKGTLAAKWLFGDGELAEGIKTSHIYNKPGKYQASLSVENKLNSMCPPSQDTRVVTVNSPPSVSIKTVESICLGNKIDFDASAAMDPDGDSLEYYWSFGDGAILKAGPKVSHEYKQGGNYRVTVIVDDGHGSACSTATANANIKVNTPPIANAGPNTSCCVDLITDFDASASNDEDGDNLSYTWNFGDGTTVSGATVKHTYTQSGSYDVILTVDDNSGTSCSQATAGFVASVNTTPVPVINIR